MTKGVNKTITSSESLHYSEENIIAIYKEVLIKKRRKFPAYFWMQNSYNKLLICLKWLIEEHLKLTDEDIKKQYSMIFFKKHKLTGAFPYLKGVHLFDILNKLYPNKYKEWELVSVPRNFWDKENATKAMEWLVKEKLNANNPEDIKKITVNTLKKYKIKSILMDKCGGSYKNTLSNIYKDSYHEWEYKKTEKSYWTDDNIKKAIIWLIEEKNKFSKEDIKRHFGTSLLKKNGLMCILTSTNKSIYEIINIAYPNTFLPWELKRVSNNYWTEENAIEAIKWLVEEKLNIRKEEDIPRKITQSVFAEHGLERILQLFFNKSTYKAINAAYPNKFKPWQFKSTPKGFWNDETQVEAIQWLVEEKLKISPVESLSKINKEDFINNGLGGMLGATYKGNYKKALKDAYPEIN